MTCLKNRPAAGRALALSSALALAFGAALTAPAAAQHDHGAMEHGAAGHDIHAHAGERELPVRGPADAVARLPYVERDGVKEFQLSAEPVLWEYADGYTIEAWAYNGQVPGPEIRVTEGDQVRIVFTNNLPEPTTIHWHGVHVPWTMDGVPGVSQSPVEPGETFVYEFEATPAGTRFYHTHGAAHGDQSRQMDMGLAGAFIIEPRDQAPAYDREFVIVLGEWQLGPDGSNLALEHAPHGDDHRGPGLAEHHMDYNLFTLNGRAFPGTLDMMVEEGELVRMRFINAGSSSTHPMHPHGHSFRIVATDGNPVPEAAQLTRDVVSVAPGERIDIEFVADNPGAWVLHCHELHHADLGMVAHLHYEGYAPMLSDEQPAHHAPAADEHMQHH